MAADDRGLDAVLVEQLERLCVVARRHLYVVAVSAQETEDGPEDQDVRRGRDVDPDSQASACATLVSRGAFSTCRSCQSVKARRPHSCRLRSSLPETWSSRMRRTVAWVEEPLPAERLGRQRVAGERLQLAAEPRCGGDREAALAAAKKRRRNEWGHGLAQQHLLAQPSHLVLGREREREVRHERVEERDARLEGVRHRGPVGLGEQIVDEVDPEVHVLQAGEELGAFRLGEAHPEQVDRVEVAAPPGELGSCVRREDLLPRVVALEGRQVRAAHEPLRFVVEARLRARRRQPFDEGTREPGQGAVPRREHVCRVRVVAAEELVAALSGEGNLDVLGSKLGDEVGREGGGVRERLVERLCQRRQQERRVGP